MVPLFFVGVIIATVSFLGGSLPSFCLKDFMQKHKAKADSFCAGIFLATVFIHLLPELSNGYQDIQTLYHDGNMKFAYVFYLVPVGFLCTLWLELTVHRLLSLRSQVTNALHSHLSSSGHFIQKNFRHMQEFSEEHHDGGCVEMKEVNGVEEAVDSGVDSTAGTPKMVSDDSHSKDKPSSASEEKKCSVSVEIVENATLEIESEEDKMTVPIPESASFVRIGSLLIAIGIHSLLEGFTLGIQETNAAVFTLGIALILHKGPEAFSYAAQTSPALSTWIANAVNLSVYTIMTPVGIFVGYYTRHLNLDGEAKDFWLLITESLGTGTFLFILFEMMKHDINFLDFALITLGFLFAGAYPLYESLSA